MPLRGRGALPSFETLAKLTPEQLVRTLARFGIAPDMGAIAAQADRAFERIGRLIDAGQVPDATTWEALEKDLTTRVENTLRDMTRDAIRGYRHERIAEVGGEFTWVAVMDEGTCVSCGGRHGKTHELAYWERTGLPGDASLVCERWCRCELMPDGTLGARPEPNPF